MINATQIRKGMVIKIEGKLYKVLEATHVTPGKGQALMQIKLRNLRDQTLLGRKIKSITPTLKKSRWNSCIRVEKTLFS
jgi:elongation factor P